MKTIVVFTDPESQLISEIKKMLWSSGDMEDRKLIEESLTSLHMIAESISHYPSLLNQQILGKHSRTLESLVDNLCAHTGLTLLLNTPTKAVLGRAFTIAKINFFILVSYICADYLHNCIEKGSIRTIISLNVFSLMAEEVFISIISDATLDSDLRAKAGRFLARIWEYRAYKGIEELEPALTELWISRQSFTPSFGTMQGISEITLFCADHNPLWLKFVEDSDFNDDTLDALKEYLMGFSYEELKKIEKYMQSKSIPSLNAENIETALGKTKLYPMMDYQDPREMYHFYTRRKNNAIFRQKSSISGPKRTIEEYIICYMLKHDMIKSG